MLLHLTYRDWTDEYWQPDHHVYQDTDTGEFDIDPMLGPVVTDDDGETDDDIDLNDPRRRWLTFSEWEAFDDLALFPGAEADPARGEVWLPEAVLPEAAWSCPVPIRCHQTVFRPGCWVSFD